ncbi:putative ATP binding protein [Hortaea werneckii]|nr:putative ATP binding protein [Hortaea werneckii]KAI6846956.1 putative ATP binding protein [Hortaea werneckii]KAI6934886.1 putative ATP binding protein [Hortaea werneckii]KAI6936870.1 putative ATP binding protein [Hortaea werneckii]KAI6979244.1 putative ATP binding protein [Hortaea werneckii]
MIKTLILPVGPPGSGKSTLTNGLQQFMTAISRPCSVANLDPANDVVPYTPAFDVRELVSVEEVMEREELGPNGGVLWAMEEIEANLEWLEDRLAECEDTVVLDPPGQPELTIHHLALPRILQRLEKIGYRIVVLQLLDSVVLTRPSLYLSSLLLCVRGMLHLPYPVVNIFTKIDNLRSLGGADLPFNLDFYTEVQDLTYLLPELSREQSSTAAGGSGKWEKLNEALVDLIQDFGLVGFETLAVEDRASMFSLLKAIDRASGYLLSTTRNADPDTGATTDDSASVWAQAMSENWTGKMDVRDVQERWVDRREEYDELERKGWEEEARMAGALPEQSAAEAVRTHARERGAEWVEGDDDGEEEDEVLREQREWEERRRRDPGLKDRSSRKIRIVFVQHNDKDPDDPIYEGKPTWELMFSPRKDDGAELLVFKDVGNVFESNAQLGQELRRQGITRIAVTGLQSDCCVRASIRGAIASGFDAANITLLQGAHSTFDAADASRSYAQIKQDVEEELACLGVQLQGWRDFTPLDV